jgi:hypothetical protein
VVPRNEDTWEPEPGMLPPEEGCSTVSLGGTKVELTPTSLSVSLAVISLNCHPYGSSRNWWDLWIFGS